MKLLIALLLLSATPTLAATTDKTAMPVCSETDLQACLHQYADAPYETFGFDDNEDGVSFFTTDGRTIRLWGIKAVEDDETATQASTILLKSILRSSQNIQCRQKGAWKNMAAFMHCKADNADVASLMIRMGLAEAVDESYRQEENVAKREGRGKWKHSLGE